MDDLYTLFGEPFMEVFRSLLLRGEWNNDDRMVRDLHQKYFANFAYTGFVTLLNKLFVLHKNDFPFVCTKKTHVCVFGLL